ncbi:hypothetical protein GS597_19575 [Synechococcales cyanobacterium C]|uniref:Uncharacterized protein n=1 Tax=Petrachloros mirabilis ULC683 TaxID=2781853 RepID=A0A8K2A9X6_9CYAN|nr:hypothetical protein [Petrachloros mirabilis]NCJ08665.1 hypothetical protein [Petrachloros mirabilis ULC683]
MSRWINLLALLPSTSLTLLVISIAFLRFYDETDFLFLGQLAHPRLWSNQLTVAALLVAVVNLGVEWNRRNRETDRLDEAEADRAKAERRRAEDERHRAEDKRRRAEERREDQARAEAERAEEKQRRVEEKQRRIGESEQAARRARVEVERDLASLSFLLDPSEQNRDALTQTIALLSEYRDSL